MGKLISAKYSVWQASLFGASLIAFGLGVLLASHINDKLAWGIVLLGVMFHGWGMYNMYKRKKD